MSSANFKPKRTAAASRGFLATARGFLVLLIIFILYTLRVSDYRTLASAFCQKNVSMLLQSSLLNSAADVDNVFTKDYDTAVGKYAVLCRQS